MPGKSRPGGKICRPADALADLFGLGQSFLFTLFFNSLAPVSGPF